MGSEWEQVFPLAELETGVPQRAKVGDTRIVVVKILSTQNGNSKEEIYALHDQCPHLGCALHKGSLEGYMLKCPCHDWIFDIRTGHFVNAPEIKIPTYEVKVEEGNIYILERRN